MPVLPEPAAESSGVARPTAGRDFLHRQLSLYRQGDRQLRLKVFFLFREQDGRAPDRSPEVPPELLFQPRKNLVPDPVAPRFELLVRRIVAKLQTVRSR